MRTIQSFLYFLFVCSLCALGACKMTEEQIRSVSPELLSQDISNNLIETETDSTTKHLPIGLVFAGLTLLVGAIIYLKSDQKVPTKPMPSRKKVKAGSERSKGRKKS